MPTVRPFAVPLSFALIAGPCAAQMAFEVTPDGHGSVVLTPSPSDGSGYAPRGGTVPFGLAPDQTVELRRQIGGLRIADIDRDGLNDLVAACYISNSFPPYEDWHDMIFFGIGTGIDTAPGWVSDVETHTGDVRVGDLNNDAWPDIVTIHGGSPRRDSVRAYFGAPAGMPTSPGYTCNTALRVWGTSTVLVDIENDGDPDLVTTNQGVTPDPFRPMLMFRNDAGTLTTDAVWQSAEQSIQNGLDAADVNADGFLDIGVAKWVNFESAIYLNNAGVLSTTPAATVGSDGTDKGAAFADVDGDTRLDLAIGGDPTKVYAYDDGVLTPFDATNPPFESTQEVHFFDVDADGDPDLGEVHFGDGRAHIYLNRQGNLDELPSWTYDASQVGTAMAFGDLNNDGRADLAVGYSGDTCIRVFFAQAPPCPADLAPPFGELNFFDVSAFLTAYNAQDPAADFAEPFGVWNFFDVSGFLTAYNAGCP